MQGDMASGAAKALRIGALKEPTTQARVFSAEQSSEVFERLSKRSHPQCQCYYDKAQESSPSAYPHRCGTLSLTPFVCP
eukprot:2269207-Amphidinium_carterae.1